MNQYNEISTLQYMGSKYYDIVAAFDNLDVIEWSQSTNTTVGDTVYVYVGDKYRSIMFKCEVVGADLYGNRFTDDYPYITSSGKIYERLSSGSFVIKDSFKLSQIYNKRERLLTKMEQKISIPPVCENASTRQIHCAYPPCV